MKTTYTTDGGWDGPIPERYQEVKAMPVRSLTEYERLSEAASDYELEALEALAERAGIISRDPETGWITYDPDTQD